jgi:biotin carboxylase
MKEYYRQAGIPTARYHLVNTLEGCQIFIQEVGYPVVVKPDNGVGASMTWELHDDEDLLHFFREKPTGILFIMEEFVHAEINSYDAIIDSQGNPLFETGNVTPISIMDVVNDNLESIYYIVKELHPTTRAAGRACVKSFGVKSRFVHFEFFRLTKSQKGLGKRGDIVGLEVNMRPSGGFTPDMINYGHETNVYKIWADMIAFDKSTVPEGKSSFCLFVGQRDAHTYALTKDEIMEKYRRNIHMETRMPEALSGAMGNQIYIATFPNKQKMNAFLKDVTAIK